MLTYALMVFSLIPPGDRIAFNLYPVVVPVDLFQEGKFWDKIHTQLATLAYRSINLEYHNYDDQV